MTNALIIGCAVSLVAATVAILCIMTAPDVDKSRSVPIWLVVFVIAYGAGILCNLAMNPLGRVNSSFEPAETSVIYRVEEENSR